VEYQNFDLWVERDGSGAYLVQGKSSQGDFRDHATVDLSAIAFDRQAFADCRVNAAALETLGQQLFDFLFETRTDAKLAALLDRSLGAVTQAEQGLRIRLQLDEANPDVASMPWEYIYRGIDKCFLASRVVTPLVRFLEVGVPLRKMEAKLPLSMLVVVPAADDLNVDLEISLLEEALGDMSGAVEMTVLRGFVTPERLGTELAKRQFDVLHFIGHGDFDGTRATLRFNDAAGRRVDVDHETIGKLIRNELSLKLLVLNSCKGATLSSSVAFVGMAPRLVAAGVPAVVAMQFPIRDDEALCFVKSFYGALFEGEDRGSVDFAICTARNALEMKFAGGRALGLPVLFMRYEEGVLFRVVTGKLLKDALVGRHEAAREKAVIREIESNHRRITAGEGVVAPEVQAQLSGRLDELARAKRRLRLRTGSIAAAALVALLIILAFAIRLLDRVPLTWLVAASPVWFGDPVGRSLNVDSIVLATTDERIDPTWRPRHAALVDKLSEAGARVVVLDIYFERPRPADDSVLAAAFTRARDRGTRVVFAARDLDNGGLKAIPALAATASIGGACLGENAAMFSGIVPLVWSKERDSLMIPSLALAAAAAWRRAQIVTDMQEVGVSLVDGGGRVLDRIQPARAVTLTSPSAECPMAVPGTRYAELLAARAPTEMWRDHQRHRRYAEILGSTPRELGWARDKIVLVGSLTEEELSRRRTGFRTDERYGVERQADALATILSDAEVLPLSELDQSLVIALGALIGVWIGLRSSRGRRRKDVVLLAGALLGFLLLATVAYRTSRTLVDVLYPSVALMLSYGVILGMRKKLMP
jgi:CHASE2 domain-containing sensor protein